MKSTIRLLVLTHNYPRYEGDHAGVFLTLLTRRLIDHHIEPIVLAPHDRDTPEREERDGVRIHRFRYARKDSDETLAYRGNMQDRVLGSPTGLMRFRRFLGAFRNAACNLVREEGIDVVAGHWLMPAGLVMKSLHLRPPLPMVLSSHGTDIRLLNRFRGMPYRFLRGLCHRLECWTTVSGYLRNRLLMLDPSLEDRLRVLPLPHDETIFFRDDSVDRDPNLVVAVTRFTEQKRVPHLIRAFAEVSQERPRTRLEIYGGGPLREEIERLVAAHGLADTVSLHEPVPQAELRAVYNRAAVVVLNSYREGFGLSLSEAMLCGAAVVGTRSGGITDIIEHERRGLLAPPDSPYDLAQAMLRLLGDDRLRMRLAEAGYHFARETYASRPLAAKYAEIVRRAARVL